jgi:Flp pilus assembly protein CpaB
MRSWLLVMASAVLVATLVGHVVSRAETTRRRWGETRPVLVTTRSVLAGSSLRAATEVRQWPLALVPDGALPSLPDHVARAGIVLTAGSAVTRASLRSPESDGRDRPRLALPLGDAHPPMRPGDQVDVWATTDPSLGDGRLSTQQVARKATVIHVDDDSATLAVRPEEVADLAAATSTSTLTLVALP